MRKLGILFAILVVLFACQALFAGEFVKVEGASPTVSGRYAACSDVLQTLQAKNGGGTGFYLELASATDEQIDEIFASYGVNRGFEAVTTLHDLEVLFPRGIEDCGLPDVFRRTSVHLAWNEVFGEKLHDDTPISSAEASYSLVGYDFLFRLEGNWIVFKFLDVASSEEIRLIGEALLAIVPGGVSWTNPMGGEIDIQTSGLSAFGFHVFVAEAKGLIYDSIY